MNERMVISLEGYDFAEAVVFVDDSFVQSAGFVMVSLLHVLVNELNDFFFGHGDLLDWTRNETPHKPLSCGVGEEQGQMSP
jgi:hypothetical protein